MSDTVQHDQPPRQPNREGVHGVFYAARGLFVADLVTSSPAEATPLLSLAEGEAAIPRDALPYDIACVVAAFGILAASPASTPLYLPIAFSTLLRPSRWADYREMLQVLPEAARGRLGAAIYDVPRAPAFQALQQALQALEPHVAAIDLRTRDPDFEIEQIPAGAVTSVTLALPDGPPRLRQAVMRRFAERLPAYRRRRVWAGLSNLRSPAEIRIAVGCQIPLLSGPAISDLLPEPAGGRSWPLARLPLTSTPAAPVARSA